MAYLEELLPEFRKGAKIRKKSWKKGEYIYLCENNIVYDEINKYFIFVNDDLFVEWELYKEPEPDWDYIIKNKCLCWFWDDKNNKNFIATLEAFEIHRYDTSFKSKSGAAWENCRPVRRDEVTFYEDKKDE